MRLIHDHGSHSHQHQVSNRAPVQNHRVTDGNTVADDGAAFFVSSVNHGAVLDIGLITDHNRHYVTAQSGVEPNRAAPAQAHVANEIGAGRDKTSFADHWSFAEQRKNHLLTPSIQVGVA